MKAGVNQVIVRVKKTRNDEIILGLGTSNPLILIKDTDFEPEKNAVIHGEVVSIPKKLSAMEVTREYDGFPTRNVKTLRYNALPIEVEVNDRVYFHFHSLDDQSLLVKEDGWLYFTVQYDQIFCSVRNGVIVPIAGYILVDPYFGNDVEEVSVPGMPSIRAKISASGIIYDRADKPRYLEGVVRYVSKYIDFVGISVMPGERVFYTTESDFENEIEGRNYYVMKIWDLFATNNDDILCPLGDWVMMDAEKIKETTDSGIFLPTPKRQPKQNNGLIAKIGGNVKELQAGDTVYFESATPNFTKVDDFVFIKEADVYYKL
jgi:co-chaperonin GroES (HSP10)